MNMYYRMLFLVVIGQLFTVIKVEAIDMQLTDVTTDTGRGEIRAKTLTYVLKGNDSFDELLWILCVGNKPLTKNIFVSYGNANNHKLVVLHSSELFKKESIKININTFGKKVKFSILDTKAGAWTDIDLLSDKVNQLIDGDKKILLNVGFSGEVSGENVDIVIKNLVKCNTDGVTLLSSNGLRY